MKLNIQLTLTNNEVKALQALKTRALDLVIIAPTLFTELSKDVKSSNKTPFKTELGDDNTLNISARFSEHMTLGIIRVIDVLSIPTAKLAEAYFTTTMDYVQTVTSMTSTMGNNQTIKKANRFSRLWNWFKLPKETKVKILKNRKR